MSTPTINSFTVVQGNGSGIQPQSPLLEIVMNFSQSSSTTDFKVECSINAGATWFVLSPITNNGGNTNVGRVPTTAKLWMSYANVPATYFGFAAQVRVSAKDTVGGSYGSPTTVTGVTLKTTKPTISFAKMAKYIGAQGNSTVNAPITVTCSSDSTKFRVDPDAARLQDSSVSPGYSNLLAAYNAVSNAQYQFNTTMSDGLKPLFVQVSDAYFNGAQVAIVAGDVSDNTILPWWQKTPPVDMIAKVIGTVGNSDYTGIHINPDTKAFSPDRSVSVQVYAKSPIPLYWQVLPTSDVEETVTSGANVSTDTSLSNFVGVNKLITANPDSATSRVKLTNHKTTPAADDYNHDATCTVKVQFTDAAGNTALADEQAIRLNTRIYKTGHTPMRVPDNQYDTVAREITPDSVERPFPRSLSLNTEVIRKWQDIYYPETHAYPRKIDGTVDADTIFVPLTDPGDGVTVRTIDQNEWYDVYKQVTVTNGFDPIVMNFVNISGVTQWRIAPDTNGRIVTSHWTKDGTRNYANLESSTVGTLRYWVIDNSGYGDFKVEFEWFDLDTGITSTPRNTLAPYAGDSLVIYDATADGALEPYVDAAGIQRYRLSNDPGMGLPLLTEIASFTGSEEMVFNLKTGLPVGSQANGDFVGDLIVSTPKIVVILFSDSQGTASGFKIKAGLAHEKVYYNYDVDEQHGEVWIHKHESLAFSGVRGSADDTTKLMTYDYMDRRVNIDYESGTVTFEIAPTGKVLADYSYHETGSYQSNLFLASWDDFVEYQEAPIYVGAPGQDAFTTDLIAQDYEVSGQGRVISAGLWNKDKGLLSFDQSSMPGPNQRLFSTYFHHSFKRLQSDGYGDLIFNDSVLVADFTPSFPDFTWADVKIVNEGDARLESGTFKFTFRGYDNSDSGKPSFGDQATMDQVWDTKRPWDIQKGTKDETYDRMGMAVLSVFPWGPLCPRKDYTPPNPNPNSNVYQQNNFAAMSIVTAHATPTVALFEPFTAMYGRVVWVLNKGSDGNYPSNTSAGPKRCSLEVSGQYYATNAF